LREFIGLQVRVHRRKQAGLKPADPKPAAPDTRIKADMPINAIAAGFIAILVGHGGSAAIIFQAARPTGADAAMIGSWMGVLDLVWGITCIGLSLRYRTPETGRGGRSVAGAAAMVLTGRR
jgi:benzoate membrane transport protein